ncbi:restriction endonuclease subunit S [Algibacter mikhailovii]|uniref:Type I restriction modification DNA specificity domain-containing protein n=1 Tax=Algibacter mikhailovii TaxID=425498 RepID=A0A918RAB6_9FLAO|nr:restriction endonuclease subunit S [Algibacter mikhailovii]GGZ88164.1 hypothetical protein GCM10007028_28110 [Algibacter mikhailovii]
MREVSLGDVCDIKNGYAFKSSEFQDKGTPLIRISSFDNGPVYFDDKTVYVDSKYLNSKSAFKVEKGDVLVALSGATTGKYGVYTKDEPGLLNQRIGLLKSGVSQDLDDKYFYYYLSVLQSEIFRKAGGAAQPNISTKAIGNFKIPLPPLDQQKKIAAILDAADAYRQKTKALITKYEELTQSLFLDMFGDPVTNPKGWEIISLVDYGSFKNGLNFSRDESGVTLKYLGVGDFKSLYKIDDLDTLSSIELNSLPSEGYLLKNGDLVFVRSNGNKALVGRCVEVTSGNRKVTFSGFCIRYRVDSPKINPSYLAQLFRNKSFKKQMLQGGRGANIQNINQKILASIKVPVPKLSIQNQFTDSIIAIEVQKAQAQASLAQAENLFNSLLQKAFKGELTA